MQVRFTVRAFDDSHGRRQPSEGTAVSCGIPLTGRRQSGRPSQRRAIPNALPKRANRWTPPDLRPYLSAQTTWGCDAHFEPPAVRAGPPVHPVARQGLAAPLPGRPWRTSNWGRGGSDPPVRGPGTGSGRGGDSHLAPALQGVATAASIPGGKAVRTPTWNAANQPAPPAAAAVAQTARAVLPASVRPRGRWLRPPTSTSAPTPRSASALRSGPRPGFSPRPWRPPVRCGGPACRESGCPRRAPPLDRTSSPCSRPSPWGSRDPPVGGSLADWVPAIQVVLFHTLSSPENRSHGHSGRFGGRFVESEAVGSPVTHELHSRRGRSTPGFGLSAEELDILAAEDRAAETGWRRARDR